MKPHPPVTNTLWGFKWAFKFILLSFSRATFRWNIPAVLSLSFAAFSFRRCVIEYPVWNICLSLEEAARSSSESSRLMTGRRVKAGKEDTQIFIVRGGWWRGDEFVDAAGIDIGGKNLHENGGGHRWWCATQFRFFPLLVVHFPFFHPIIGIWENNKWMDNKFNLQSIWSL